MSAPQMTEVQALGDAIARAAIRKVETKSSANKASVSTVSAEYESHGSILQNKPVKTAVDGETCHARCIPRIVMSETIV